ncbi:MAG: HAD family hydrolase [Parvibaculum sp.]
MENLSLIIFDCDGVLVDTEALSNRLLAEILTGHGLPISYEECRRRFVGKSMKSVMAEVEASLGRALPGDWLAQERERTLALLAQETKAVPGVRAQILHLRSRDIPHCVASSGTIEKMHTTLGCAGLLPLLKDVLFTADMVTNGKPAPDLFLHAARQMGHAPATCVVIEDSLPGVQAGIAAGMRVLGYAGDPMTDAAGLERAGAIIFHDMADLADQIAKVA